MSAQVSLYKVIDLLLTKAALSGKITKSIKHKIPYNELTKSVGINNYSDVDLQVEIKLKWVKTERK